MKTEWNLGLLYKNDKDPQIEKDIVAIEKACASFEKKYRGKGFTASPRALAGALVEYQKLSDSSLHKPWLYFFLRKDTDSENSDIRARCTAVEQRINIATNKVTFFSLEVAKIPVSKQSSYLNSPLLKDVSYYLERIFTSAKYYLSEKEEQMESLLNQTSEGMWVDAQIKLIGQQKVLYKGEMIPFSKARDILSDLPKKERHALYKNIVEAMKAVSFLAEAELNALGNYRKVMDELRGYKTPYSASVIAKENTEKEIKAFTDLVTSYFHLSHRFHKLHAMLIGEKKLNLSDRRAPIGKIKQKFDFETTVSITKRALSRASEKYGTLVQQYADNGQLDVYPKEGKVQGGYCISVGTLPTFILLNQVDNIQSVETLAHEMGHAIHGELDNHLPVFYQGHSTATAEVASMFFEQFVGLEVEKYLTDEEKFFLLHRTVSEDMYGIFCQVACFNFELELHERIRKEGQLSKEKMAEIMQRHLQSYCGDAMEVTLDDGYLFATWPHIRYNFYTYSYAYGGLISRVLFENWKKDQKYISKVEQFLSAGRSMSPKDIFKSIGINTNEAFFEAGLKGIEADIDKLEKLSKNWLKKQKKK